MTTAVLAPSTESLGARIARLRRRRGMSQVACAGLVGRSEDWLSKVENGRIPIDRLSVLRELARVLRVDVLTLLEGCL
jgi:transcriptional regulator with XRE-family HTH domain